MSESCYNEIFENIKSNLVPKAQYEESQLEIERLKSELENVKENLKRTESKYEKQQLRIGIVRRRLIEAEKECLESEKKTFELKSKKLSLKLKLKTNQFDSLLSTKKTGTQTVKEEPTEIGIVNVPASLSSGSGTKRTGAPKITIPLSHFKSSYPYDREFWNSDLGEKLWNEANECLNSDGVLDTSLAMKIAHEMDL